jgi:release factor glutamine methyltransferase
MSYENKLNEQGYVVWMTGLSGSGKTTIALVLEEELRDRGLKVERLDGDIVRESLTSDLGFSADDRRKNIERVTFVAKLLSRNGVGTICSFISPYQSVRDHVRENTTNFLEVFIDAPLDVVIDRDVKGLYKKAIAGEIPNLAGSACCQNMTIEEAWAYGCDRLAQASFTPELDARLLLQHVLRVAHSYLIAHNDVQLTEQQEKAYKSLLARASNKEPIPYLTGKAFFYGLELEVSPAVLIPRPETEELVERALTWVGSRRGLRVVDVGTGSGCIAVALSRYLAGASITAVDVSASALEVARQNASLHARLQIRFLQGNLLESLSGPFDLILANLPYVAYDEWTMVDGAVKWYEPPVALWGGADGLDLIRELLRQAVSRLEAGGAISPGGYCCDCRSRRT